MPASPSTHRPARRKPSARRTCLREAACQPASSALHLRAGMLLLQPNPAKRYRQMPYTTSPGCMQRLSLAGHPCLRSIHPRSPEMRRVSLSSPMPPAALSTSRTRAPVCQNLLLRPGYAASSLEVIHHRTHNPNPPSTRTPSLSPRYSLSGMPSSLRTGITPLSLITVSSHPLPPWT
jgi:hypothetical protein